MKKITDQNILTLDFTNEIDKRVKELFPNSSSTYHQKVLFLLYLINKESKNGYQLHSRNHQAFLGLENSISYILSPLENNNIIKKITGYTKGESAIKYVLVAPYKWPINRGDIKVHFKHYEELPTYLKKYVSDSFTVRSAKSSYYKKGVNPFNLSIDDITTTATVNELQNENLLLKSEIEKLKEIIKNMENNNNTTPTPIQELKKTAENELIVPEKQEKQTKPLPTIDDLKKDIYNHFKDFKGEHWAREEHFSLFNREYLKNYQNNQIIEVNQLIYKAYQQTRMVRMEVA